MFLGQLLTPDGFGIDPKIIEAIGQMDTSEWEREP